MFQYAFGRHLALKNNTILKLDLGFFNNQPLGEKKHVFRSYDLPVFNIQETLAGPAEVFHLSRRFKNNFLEKSFNKIFGYRKTYLNEPHYHFSEKAYEAPDNRYLAGYWQSAKYFQAQLPSVIRLRFVNLMGRFKKLVSRNFMHTKA